jgi:hypothetical protein
MIGFRLLLGQGRVFFFTTAYRSVLGRTRPRIQWVPIIFPEGKAVGT